MRSLLHCLLIACLVATINAANATETTSATTEASAAADTTEAPAVSPITSQPQIEITKLELNEHELEALLQLDEAINEQQQQLAADDKQPQRTARHIKDEQLTTETVAPKPATLSDDDINAIMQMIKFPADGQQEVMKVDNETLKVNADEIEPRQSGNRQGRGYYILAFAPANDDDEVAEQEQLNYNRIDIIPEERFSGKAARYFKQEKREEKREEALEQSHRTEDDEEEIIDDDEEDYDLWGKNADTLIEDEADDEVEARFISMRQLNRYIRRLMRQIRKGTRKITRKTRVKKKSADPTVENFLKGLYEAQQQKKAKKTAWFSW